MTTQIDNEMNFLGWPMSKLRAVLKSFHVGKGSFADYGHLAAVKLTAGAAAGILGEAFLRGFIGRVDEEGDPCPDAGFSLTRTGRAIAAATARKRTTKVNARKVVDQLIGKAISLSKEDDAPIKVARIWLFGSFIDPSREDVGDLDLVIETYLTGIEGTGSYRRRLEYISERYPGFLPANIRSQLFADPDGHFMSHKLYGGRKPALLAPNDIETLKSLGCACSLYYDHERGGKIEPISYHRHPDSAGRENHIREKLVMPEFPPMAEYEFTPPIVATTGFLRGASSDDVETNQSRVDNVIEDRFLLETSAREVPITMTRKLTFGDVEWVYEASMSAPKGMSVDRKDKVGLFRPDIRAALDLVHADVLRLAAFRHDSGKKVQIYADVAISKKLAAWDSYFDHTVGISGLHDHETFGFDAFPDQYSWGVDLLVNDMGRGYVGPSEMDDDDWENMRLPFSKAEYEEWVAETNVSGEVEMSMPIGHKM